MYYTRAFYTLLLFSSLPLHADAKSWLSKMFNTIAGNNKSTKKADPSAHLGGPTIRDMNYIELATYKHRLLSENNKLIALKVVDRMIPLAPNLQEQRNLLFEKAELLFDLGNLSESESNYNEFKVLYPGDTKLETVCYKEILASFYQTLDPDRDQTKTKDTLKLAQDFLARNDVFVKNSDEVKKIKQECQKKLIDSEQGIIAFDIHRNKFNPARLRIARLEKDYSSEFPEVLQAVAQFEQRIQEKEIEAGIRKPATVNISGPSLAQNFNNKQPNLDKQTPAPKNLVAKNTARKKGPHPKRKF